MRRKYINKKLYLKAKNWCKTVSKHPIEYFECSAKDATNVDSAF